MIKDFGNRTSQKIIFVISLITVIIGVATIITSGISTLFEFDDPLNGYLTVKQQPFIVLFLFSIIALFLSGRNLKNMRDKKS